MGNGANKATDKIVKEYQLTKEEKKLIIGTFKAKSENGHVTKETWMLIVQDQGVTEGLAESIWNAFNKGSTSMDMDAFIAMLGVCIGGTVDQKLNVSFDLFDLERDQMLSPAGVSAVLEQCYLYEVSKRCGDMKPDLEGDRKDIERLTKLIFEELDEDHDGKISRDEFLKGVRRNPCIEKLMKKF